jgi:hypothetical protein
VAIRAAQPDLRFEIASILDSHDLVAVVGHVGHGPIGDAATRLIWLIRLESELMAEMWTFIESAPPEAGKRG